MGRSGTWLAYQAPSLHMRLGIFIYFSSHGELRIGSHRYADYLSWGEHIIHKSNKEFCCMTNPNSVSLISPLRYPGSKRRLVGYIEQAILLNDLKPKLFIEPFVGGASVALQLMQDDLVEKVILMDIDPLVASFWRTVFFDTDWLIEQIETIDVTLENWYWFKEFVPETTRQYALKCLFINRTSFSGIMEGRAGPLGGRQQLSEYKIDCRFPRETLIKRVRQAAIHKDRILAIWDCSWDEGLQRIREKQRIGSLPDKNLFFYMDPPFFEKADALYRFHFQQQDHFELRNFLLKLRDSWILSYDAAPHVETLYGDAIKSGTNGTKKHNVELIYSTGIMTGRKPTKEVIISNLNDLPSETRFWKTASGILGK